MPSGHLRPAPVRRRARVEPRKPQRVIKNEYTPVPRTASVSDRDGTAGVNENLRSASTLNTRVISSDQQKNAAPSRSLRSRFCRIVLISGTDALTMPRILAGFALLVFLTFTATADTVQGIIKDPSGAVVAGALITVRDPAGLVIQTVSS